MVSTPGKTPTGSAASRDACGRALGQALSDHRCVSSLGGCRQHIGSGQRDADRSVVSRPRNQRTCANGTPTLTENAPCDDGCTRDVHQYVPDEVSVYW